MPHVRPDFLWSLVALANFMRLSLQKAAHANLSGAACRKSGSPERTWEDHDIFRMLFLSEQWISGSIEQNANGGLRPSFWAHVRSSDPDFLHAAPDRFACAAFCKESRMKFARATKLHRKSGRTWGTRPVLWLIKPCYDTDSYLTEIASALMPPGL